MEEAKFEPMHFYGRHAQIALCRDHWGPFVEISFKRRGLYQMLVKRFGSPDALLHKRFRVNDPSQKVISRLPAGMNTTCLEKVWIKIKQLPATF